MLPFRVSDRQTDRPDELVTSCKRYVKLTSILLVSRRMTTDCCDLVQCVTKRFMNFGCYSQKSLESSVFRSTVSASDSLQFRQHLHFRTHFLLSRLSQRRRRKLHELSAVHVIIAYVITCRRGGVISCLSSQIDDRLMSR